VENDYVERVRLQFRSGNLSDAAFDALLPPVARLKSRVHWSPLVVARRAARQFERTGARRILDVGCGPGKFCIGAAFTCEALTFYGVDRDLTLVETATDLGQRLLLRTVDFRVGDALAAPWREFDGFYFYNPFVRDAPRLPASIAAERSDFAQTTELLLSARKGTLLITYHGLGGFIPSSYDLLCEEPAGDGPLRTWLKVRSKETDWHYVDDADGVSRVPSKYVESALRQRRHPVAASD
jgi:SAM-dependent methyltransferase